MPTTVEFLIALILTCLVEWTVIAGLKRTIETGWMIDLLLINALTNPLANAAVHALGVGFWPTELVVWATEMILFRTLWKISWRRAASYSLAANLASALVSFLF